MGPSLQCFKNVRLIPLLLSGTEGHHSINLSTRESAHRRPRKQLLCGKLGAVEVDQDLLDLLPDPRGDVAEGFLALDDKGRVNNSHTKHLLSEQETEQKDHSSKSLRTSSLRRSGT